MAVCGNGNNLSVLAFFVKYLRRYSFLDKKISVIVHKKEQDNAIYSLHSV